MAKIKVVTDDIVEDVKLEEKSEPEYVVGTVIANMLAIRPTPSTELDPLYIVYKGDNIEVVAVDDNWYSVKNGGFCMSKYVKI